MLLTIEILLCGILGNVISVNDQRVPACLDAQVAHSRYHVSLRTSGQHFCSGSIIGPRWVLTSANCVAGFISNPTLIKAVVGTTILYIGGSTYTVIEVIPHPGYTSGSYVHNIAVLNISMPMAFTSTVNSILLATPSPVPSPLTPCIFTAWHPLQPLPRTLKQIFVTTTPMSCPAYFPVTTSATANLCTVSNGDCTCKCDHGGPLVNNNGRQVGVLLWVSPCSMGNADIFASVPEYRTWIWTETGI